MRRYLTLFFITFFLLGVLKFYDSQFKTNVKSVAAICLRPITARNYVTCTGRVEYGNTADIYLEKNSIISDLRIQVGDRVSEGDVIMTVAEFSNDDINKLKNISNISDIYKSIEGQGEIQMPEFLLKDLDIGKANRKAILACSSGIVTSVNVHKNMIAASNTSAVSISEDGALQIRLSINECRISEIKVGQLVEINGIGFKGVEYKGKVRKIADEARQLIGTTGTETVVDVIVSVDKCDNIKYLKPGFTANCRIQTEESPNLVVTPYNAVRAEDDGREYVYKYNNGKVKKSYIITGKEFDLGFEVISGVSENDMVVTNPDNLNDSSYVKLTERSILNGDA